MRKISFRAKDAKDNWIYGTPVFADGPNSQIAEMAIIDISGNSMACDPLTLGQFTGLLDRDKQEIFEGDILSVESPHALIEDYIREVRFVDGCFAAVSSIGVSYNLRLSSLKGRVVGNIHDKPGLL